MIHTDVSVFFCVFLAKYRVRVTRKRMILENLNGETFAFIYRFITKF